MRAAGLVVSMMMLGCGVADPCDGVSGVCITARVEGNAQGLDQLVIGLDSQTRTTPTAPKAFSLPVRLSVRIAGAGGQVKLSIVGLRQGTVIAFDEKTIAATRHVQVTFTLNAGTGGERDLSVPPDLATGSDLAGQDFAEPPDLTEIDMACAAGTQDNDNDGTCLPDCANAGLDCTGTLHSVCSDATGTATCTCLPGYVMAGSDCVWGTVPRDPGFEDVPMGAWTVERGALVQPAAGGNLEPGQLFFDKNTICTSHGRARQTIQMPPYSRAEPLALKVASHQDCSNGMFSCPYGGVDVNINGAGTFFKMNTVSTIETVCLGERAYNGPVELIVRPWTADSCLGAVTYSLYVDHVSVEPAPTCPSPAPLVPNGDMEGTDNWTFTMAGTGAGSLQAAVGNPGKAAHISVGITACANASVTGLISAPLSMPNVALKMDLKVTSGVALPIYTTDSKVLGTYVGTGAYQTVKFCLGEFAKGMVVPIKATVDACALAQDAYLDNLSFVTDATCPATAYVADPGFERTDLGNAWYLSVSGNPNQSIVVDAIAANAHGGTRSLKISQGQECAAARAYGMMTVPAATATEGPALKFFYKLPVQTNASFSSTPGGALVVAANYTEKTVCLDPSKAGHPVELTFSGSDAGGGTCANTYALETMWVDDITVGTDPSCPTN